METVNNICLKTHEEIELINKHLQTQTNSVKSMEKILSDKVQIRNKISYFLNSVKGKFNVGKALPTSPDRLKLEQEKSELIVEKKIWRKAQLFFNEEVNNSQSKMKDRLENLIRFNVEFSKVLQEKHDHDEELVKLGREREKLQLQIQGIEHFIFNKLSQTTDSQSTTATSSWLSLISSLTSYWQK